MATFLSIVVFPNTREKYSMSPKKTSNQPKSVRSKELRFSRHRKLARIVWNQDLKICSTTKLFPEIESFFEFSDGERFPGRLCIAATTSSALSSKPLFYNSVKFSRSRSKSFSINWWATSFSISNSSKFSGSMISFDFKSVSLILSPKSASDFELIPTISSRNSGSLRVLSHSKPYRCCRFQIWRGTFFKTSPRFLLQNQQL